MEDAVISLKKITSCLNDVPEREETDKAFLAVEDEIRSHYLLYLKNIISQEIYSNHTIVIIDKGEVENAFLDDFRTVTLEYFHELLSNDYKTCVVAFFNKMKKNLYHFIAQTSKMNGIILSYEFFSCFCMNVKEDDGICSSTAFDITKSFISQSVMHITIEDIFQLFEQKDLTQRLESRQSREPKYKFFVKRSELQKDIHECEEWTVLQSIIAFCVLIVMWSTEKQITTYSKNIDGQQGHFSLAERVQSFVELNVNSIHIPVEDFMKLITSISNSLLDQKVHPPRWFNPGTFFRGSHASGIDYDNLFKSPPPSVRSLATEIFSI